jgi:hypothetical protein
VRLAIDLELNRNVFNAVRHKSSQA